MVRGSSTRGSCLAEDSASEALRRIARVDDLFRGGATRLIPGFVGHFEGAPDMPPLELFKGFRTIDAEPARRLSGVAP